MFSLIVLSVSAAGYGQNAGPVTLFQGPNATGAGQDIPPGTYRVSGKEIGAGIKDPVFSVQVAKGFLVRFCEEPKSGMDVPKSEE